ncbi:hypothetical protein KK062_24445 [Fulvivirgaceae bacterium PWU5]|uniref:Imm33-like domain-containing protein n=1 Tax=Dawidia cretensis TaxID=2782350 RepID=A0AAP2E2A8_9BACT|nr:hypothetical protein [Dawidia cretensis]MBT1711415.1 hypothetical protein [Dawidia cretensis]
MIYGKNSRFHKFERGSAHVGERAAVHGNISAVTWNNGTGQGEAKQTGYCHSDDLMNRTTGAGYLERENDTGASPKAYLDYPVFDHDFYLLNGGYKRLTTSARETGNLLPEGVGRDTLAFEEGDIKITEPGFVYIYFSNASNKMEEIKDIKNEQIAICRKYDVVFCESPDFLKVGISRNIKEGARPIHGLRHPLEGNTTGWYIWGDEYSEDPDFFVPLHVEHLKEWCPLIVKYLGLPPGWRFLITENYEDVWEDKDLLNI